jgi:hypothetical protein
MKENGVIVVESQDLIVTLLEYHLQAQCPSCTSDVISMPSHAEPRGFGYFR